MGLKYFKIRLLALYRSWYGIGMFRALIILLLLLVFMAIYIHLIPNYFSNVLIGSMIYMLHTNRKDKKFIKSIFRKKSTIIYWTEYLLLSSFFLVVMIYKEFYNEIYIALILIISSPFTFVFKIKWKGINNPLFLKGGYEYILGLRTYFVLMLVCYSLCLIGIFKDNLNITFVFYMAIGILFSTFLTQPEPLIYSKQYSSVKNFIYLKLKQILWNNFATLIPIAVICVFVHSGASKTIIYAFILINILTITAFFIKQVIRNKFITELLLLLLIVPIYIGSFLYYLLIVPFVLIMLLALKKTITNLTPLYYYDKSKLH